MDEKLFLFFHSAGSWPDFARRKRGTVTLRSTFVGKKVWKKNRLNSWHICSVRAVSYIFNAFRYIAHILDMACPYFIHQYFTALLIWHNFDDTDVKLKALWGWEIVLEFHKLYEKDRICKRAQNRLSLFKDADGWTECAAHNSGKSTPAVRGPQWRKPCQVWCMNSPVTSFEN